MLFDIAIENRVIVRPDYLTTRQDEAVSPMPQLCA